jgi:hypothetical protein
MSIRPPVAAAATALSAEEARALAAELVAVMDELAPLMEQETALVREGKLAQASALAEPKTELTRRYVACTLRLPLGKGRLAPLLADGGEALRARHQAFRAQLQTNLTVLATAHAISEGIVRGVSGELTRKSAPQAYGRSGRPVEPPRNASTPLAVSRVL